MRDEESRRTGQRVAGYLMLGVLAFVAIVVIASLIFGGGSP